MHSRLPSRGPSSQDAAIPHLRLATLAAEELRVCGQESLRVFSVYDAEIERLAFAGGTGGSLTPHLVDEIFRYLPAVLDKENVGRRAEETKNLIAVLPHLSKREQSRGARPL